jgi:hypothetical protein
VLKSSTIKLIFSHFLLFKEKNPGLETKFKKSKEKVSESYQETDETDENRKVGYFIELPRNPFYESTESNIFVVRTLQAKQRNSRKCGQCTACKIQDDCGKCDYCLVTICYNVTMWLKLYSLINCNSLIN